MTMFLDTQKTNLETYEKNKVNTTEFYLSN